MWHWFEFGYFLDRVLDNIRRNHHGISSIELFQQNIQNEIDSIHFFSIQKSFIATQNIAFYTQTQDIVQFYQVKHL